MTPCEAVTLERAGVPENRRFYLVDERGTMVNGKVIGELSRMISEYRDEDGTLTVILPGGERVTATVDTGAEIDARFFSMTLRARLVVGPWSQATDTVESPSPID